MAKVILEDGSKVQCKCSMINRATRTQILVALQTGLIELQESARRVANTTRLGESLERDVADQIVSGYMKYPARPLHSLELYLQFHSRDGVATLYCRVMESLAFATPVVREERVVTGRLPVPVPA